MALAGTDPAFREWQKGVPFRGFGFPVKKRDQGFFTPFVGRDTIRAKIFIVLGCRPGEVPHLPRFGSLLHRLVHEQSDVVFDILADEYVRLAVEEWIPEIQIVSFQVIRDNEVEPNKVQLSMHYVHRDRSLSRVERPEGAVIVFNRNTGLVATLGIGAAA